MTRLNTCLGDLCEITSSKRIFYHEYTQTGIPFYRSKEIIELSENQAVSTGLFISPNRFLDIKGKFGVPRKRDILLTSVGTLGKVYLVTGDHEFYFKDGNLTWFRNWSKDVVPEFIYWWLRSPLGFQSLLDISIGSTQPALTISGLKNIKVTIPSLGEQEAIAEVLSSLDDKIDLLQRQNKTLEQMAETLFRQWFTGDRQNNWTTEKLEPYIKLVTGYSYKSEHLSESSTALVGLKNFDRAGGFRVDGYKEYTGPYKPEQVVVPGDLIVAHTDITQEAEVLGNPALVLGRNQYNTLVITTDVAKVQPTDYLTKEYLYYLLRTPDFKAYCLGMSNGTTVLHLPKKAVPSYEFAIPPQNLVEKFTQQASALHEKRNKNEHTIAALSNLRDLLLPKLMNGTVRVSPVNSD